MQSLNKRFIQEFHRRNRPEALFSFIDPYQPHPSLRQMDAIAIFRGSVSHSVGIYLKEKASFGKTFLPAFPMIDLGTLS
jgi:hypothetical protein